jgi:hypothetical protein
MPNNISPKEIFKTVWEVFLITLKAVTIFALTVVWALATAISTVIRWMVEQFTAPPKPKPDFH